jgi:hypothetical protein
MTLIYLVITNLITFVAGVWLGSKYEQRAIARALAICAASENEAKELIGRAYHYFGQGVKDELKRLGL